MSTAVGNVALGLSEYIVGLRYEDLPAEVVQRAKTSTLDAIGCMIMGCCIPLGPIMIQMVRDLGGVPESTVVTGGFKTSCVNATLANGTLVHADELDEIGTIGVGGHPGAVAIPASLAMAEREGASGKAYITALVLGYDVHNRVGEAVGARIKLPLRSFTPAVIGCFPGAAVAGKLLGLPVEQVNHALGLAGATTGGVQAWLDGESQHMTKALTYGHSSCVGVRSALLAQQGFAGPPSIFQGKFSVVNALVDQADLTGVTRDLGTRFDILSARLKKYSAGGPIQSSLDGLLKIMAEQGLQPEDLAEVMVQMPTKGNRHLLADDPATRGINLEYLLAVAAYDRKLELEAHSEERAKDPRVWELQNRIRLVWSSELDRDPELNAAAIVELRTRNGQTFTEQVVHPTGSPQNPMSQQEIEEKFFSLSSQVISRAQAERILDMVGNLENMQNLRELGDFVRGK
jgi:2-methylcitrate dehydratase PrpD